MGKDDWALALSLGSLAIACAAFVWNIWSKFIYPKPRLRLAFWVARVVQGDECGPQFLSLDMTNHGPVPVTVSCAIVRDRRSSFWRRGRLGMINPIHDLKTPELPMGPFAGGLPKQIEVGETFSLHFPFEHGGWLAGPVVRIGVRDTFSRFHWAPRDQFRRVRKTHRQQFGE